MDFTFFGRMIERSSSRNYWTRFMNTLTLLGTDSDEGRHLEASAFQDELYALSDAGLSPYEVFHAATVGNATLVNILNETGTVAINKRADLLRLSDNPLKDLHYLKNLKMVIARGRIVYENK